MLDKEFELKILRFAIASCGGGIYGFIYQKTSCLHNKTPGTAVKTTDLSVVLTKISFRRRTCAGSETHPEKTGEGGVSIGASRAIFR